MAISCLFLIEFILKKFFFIWNARLSNYTMADITIFENVVKKCLYLMSILAFEPP